MECERGGLRVLEGTQMCVGIGRDGVTRFRRDERGRRCVWGRGGMGLRVLGGTRGDADRG
jgi:hypothetical protein